MTQIKAIYLTAPEEIENGGFTLKTHQMFFVHTRKRIKCFSVHTTPEEFTEKRNNPVPVFFVFVFEENIVCRGNHVIIATLSFSKISIFKMVPIHRKTKSRHF